MSFDQPNLVIRSRSGEEASKPDGPGRQWDHTWCWLTFSEEMPQPTEPAECSHSCGPSRRSCHERTNLEPSWTIKSWRLNELIGNIISRQSYSTDLIRKSCRSESGSRRAMQALRQRLDVNRRWVTRRRSTTEPNRRQVLGPRGKSPLQAPSTAQKETGPPIHKQGWGI